MLTMVALMAALSRIRLEDHMLLGMCSTMFSKDIFSALKPELGVNRSCFSLVYQSEVQYHQNAHYV